MGLKIIHIGLGKANPNRLNGVNKVIDSIASAQSKLGFDVSYWGLTNNLYHDYPARNYKTNLYLDTGWFQMNSSIRAAVQKIKKGETIIHFHGGFIPQFVKIARYLTKLNIPYFFTPHGAYNLIALKKSSIKKKVFIQFCEKSIVNNAVGTQILGPSELEGLNKYFKTNEVLVPNGQKMYGHLKQSKEAESILKIGFIGRIDIRTKGLDVFLKGIKVFAEKTPIIVEVIGAGGEEKLFKKMVADYGLQDAIIFKGALFGDEKLKQIATWDALCLLSRNEGMPGVVLEAGSVGVPVIVTEQTNMGDYLRKYDAGWILDAPNVTDFVAALNELKSKKQSGEIKRLENNIEEMVATEFDWNNIANTLLASYVKR